MGVLRGTLGECARIGAESNSPDRGAALITSADDDPKRAKRVIEVESLLSKAVVEVAQ
jgi:hypothetical protein